MYYRNIQIEKEDAVDYLSLFFNVDSVDNIRIPELLLLLIYECDCITMKQLHNIFPICSSFDFLKVNLNRLKDKGLVDVVKLKETDCHSRVVYRLTKTGGENVKNLINRNFEESYFRGFKAIRDRIVFHQYGNGLNFLNMLLVGEAFKYEKEQSYGNDIKFGSKKKIANRLCVDSVYTFHERGFTFFIEEDLGTESSGVLKDKIDIAYVLPGMSSALYDNMCYSFSFHCPVKKLPMVKSESFDFVRQLNKLYKFDNIGAMDVHMDNAFKKSSFNAPAEKVLCSRDNVVLLKNALLASGDRNMGVGAFLEKTGDSAFLERVNDVFHSSAELSFAKRRKATLIDAYVDEYKKAFGRNEIKGSGLYHMLSGLRCVCMPSMISYDFIKRTLDCRNYSNIIMKYIPFKGFRIDSYIYVNKIGNASLLNCYTGDDGLLCIEDAEWDIGAYLRCVAAAYTLNKGPVDKKLYVCVLIDSVDTLKKLDSDTDGLIRRGAIKNTFFFFRSRVDSKSSSNYMLDEKGALCQLQVR